MNKILLTAKQGFYSLTTLFLILALSGKAQDDFVKKSFAKAAPLYENLLKTTEGNFKDYPRFVSRY